MCLKTFKYWPSVCDGVELVLVSCWTCAHTALDLPWDEKEAIRSSSLATLNFSVQGHWGLKTKRTELTAFSNTILVEFCTVLFEATTNLLLLVLDFAEKLLKQLENCKERFEVKMMLMDLISRLVGIHEVCTVNVWMVWWQLVCALALCLCKMSCDFAVCWKMMCAEVLASGPCGMTRCCTCVVRSERCSRSLLVCDSWAVWNKQTSVPLGGFAEESSNCLRTACCGVQPKLCLESALPGLCRAGERQSLWVSQRLPRSWNYSAWLYGWTTLNIRSMRKQASCVPTPYWDDIQAHAAWCLCSVFRTSYPLMARPSDVWCPTAQPWVLLWCLACVCATSLLGEA